MRRLTVFAILAWPLEAAAHTETGPHHWWTLDPWVWLPMAVVAALHVRGMLILRAKHSAMRALRPYAVTSFWAGMIATFFALVWPLDALGTVSFAAHMAQHMVLIAVAAPLFVLAEPATPLLRAMPTSWRRAHRHLAGLHKALQRLLRPRIAFAVHGGLIWLWHAPLLFEWALRWQWVHMLEHVSFLGSALLFWQALQRAGRGKAPGSLQGYGSAALLTLATLIHTGFLGALITFAPRPLYAFYAELGDAPLSVMDDQQLAGLLMWIPAGLCYLVAGLSYAEAWLRSAERGASREDATPH